MGCFNSVNFCGMAAQNNMRLDTLHGFFYLDYADHTEGYGRGGGGRHSLKINNQVVDPAVLFLFVVL